ncbi:YigZ family protein [Alkalibacterium kapii]|uniref:YigZ family protein n=1 Tax=Alkalibacterium kapii TaxID=426704 RepID=A0A511AQM6_9LACT|nr:YigZ family protein [Alkalibacterium kapii]GEK90489.1 YigZ family protein [Alkalibacterium kapii]
MENHRTIKQKGSHEITIKKSRFICTIERTESEEEAQAFIERIKKTHWKATHNCSAYLINGQTLIQRASDDGEPNGTAGIPILEVLKKKELLNVTAVVTRYFGGVKLGAGGLIRAYGKATSSTLERLGIVEKKLHRFVSLTVSYPVSGKLQNLLEESPYMIHSIDYTEEVTFHCLIPSPDIDHFKEKATDWTNGSISFQDGKDAWIETPVK